MSVGIICACMPACAAVFRQPHPKYLLFPSFEPLKSWFSKRTASLLSNKSTSQSLEHSASEKAESDMRPSQENGVGVTTSSLSRNNAW